MLSELYFHLKNVIYLRRLEVKKRKKLFDKTIKVLAIYMPKPLAITWSFLTSLCFHHFLFIHSKFMELNNLQLVLERVRISIFSDYSLYLVTLFRGVTFWYWGMWFNRPMTAVVHSSLRLRTAPGSLHLDFTVKRFKGPILFLQLYITL